MRKLRYTFKTDTLFKMLFVKHPDLLQKLVSALLSIPLESIERFEIRNGEIAPENLKDKFCRLDINMVVNGQLVDLEIQVADEGDYPERVMLYWAREFSSALPAGERYTKLPRTIIVSILDFNQFDCKEFHSFFQPMETTRHTLLSDKMGFHFFELRKLPDVIDHGDSLSLWLALFRAETEDDLKRIKKMEVPMMNQAIDAYYTITASPEFREVERLREKARHDEAQALYHAEQRGMQRGRQEGKLEGKLEGKFEIVRNALQMQVPLSDIVKLTGLSYEEIERFHLDH